MKKSFIVFLIIALASCCSVEINAQSKGKGKAAQTQVEQPQGTFRVYALLKLITKGRMALDFGQKSEGGLFYGEISDILLDENGKDYQIDGENGMMKLINELSAKGWRVTGGITASDKLWHQNIMFYKDVRNKQEIIQGLRFKKP